VAVSAQTSDSKPIKLIGVSRLLLHDVMSPIHEWRRTAAEATWAAMIGSKFRSTGCDGVQDVRDMDMSVERGQLAGRFSNTERARGAAYRKFREVVPRLPAGPATADIAADHGSAPEIGTATQ